jgi:hypothetical protein
MHFEWRMNLDYCCLTKVTKIKRTSSAGKEKRGCRLALHAKRPTGQGLAENSEGKGKSQKWNSFAEEKFVHSNP